MGCKDRAEVAIVVQGDGKDILIRANFIYCLLRQVEATGLIIDVFCHGSEEIAKFAFGMQPYVAKVYGSPKEDEEFRYDACIYLQQYPEVVFWNNTIEDNYPKLLTIMKRWKKFIQDAPLRQYELVHPDKGINHWLYAINNGRNCINAMDVHGLLGMKKCYEYQIDIEPQEEVRILQQYGVKAGEYFTVYYEVSYKERRFTEECLIQQYELLMRYIKEKYSDFKIVQMVSENTPVLSGMDIKVGLDDVNIDDLACLMKNAKIHVGCDNMLLHLRAITGGGKSVTMYGQPLKEYSAIEGNLSIDVQEMDMNEALERIRGL